MTTLIPNACERICEVNLAVPTPREQAENTNQQISSQTVREPAGLNEYVKAACLWGNDEAVIHGDTE